MNIREVSPEYVERLLRMNSVKETAYLIETSENTLRKFMEKHNIKNTRTSGKRVEEYGAMVYMFSEEFGCWATTIHFKTSQDAVHTIRVRYKRKAKKLLETLNKD